MITTRIDTIYEQISDSVLLNITRDLNAPEFAWYCLHGEVVRMRGRQGHPEKLVNGIVVDKDLPDSAIIELNKIPQIEVRASCQGDDTVPTYVIFRLTKYYDNIDLNKNIVHCINSKLQYGKSCFGYGRQGFIRICIVANRNELGPRFNLWWKQLPKLIEDCVKEL